MKHLSLILSLLFFGLISGGFACTEFRITAKDNTHIIARSLEYAQDLKSNLRTSTRARVFNTLAPDGKPGLSWKAKYGYVYLDALNYDMACDGMNEKGLSFGALYLPNQTQYQTVPVELAKQALPYVNIGDWILSNFDSVDQVKQALPTVYVYAQKLPGFGDMIFPLHFSIYDANGKGLVVEYVNGKLNMYDNIIGIFTNTPTYDWHLTNLVNYIHLIPENPNPVVDNGILFAATGQGFGMVGLPGDISPPSRFVKIATMTRVVLPGDNGAQALNVAEHVMNNVDIPLGFVREPNKGNYTNELTQWVVFKDLTNKIFYYRTYLNLTLRGVSLAKLNFAENAPRLKMPIMTGTYVLDMSNQFLGSAQSPELSTTTSKREYIPMPSPEQKKQAGIGTSPSKG